VIILELLWYFLAGAFAFNGLPHLVKGITGQPNMTPFAKVSSPILNIVWAFVNFGLALYLLGLASDVFDVCQFIWQKRRSFALAKIGFLIEFCMD
jgi:hypothetical protein